jgi:hypothetical protein
MTEEKELERFRIAMRRTDKEEIIFLLNLINTQKVSSKAVIKHKDLM